MWSEGFIGKLQGLDARRVAFWFTIFGPLVMLSGHIAIYAVSEANFSLLRVVGFYVLVVSIFGIFAFPKSPFWGTLILSPILIAGSFGLIA